MSSENDDYEPSYQNDQEEYDDRRPPRGTARVSWGPGYYTDINGNNWWWEQSIEDVFPIETARKMVNNDHDITQAWIRQRIPNCMKADIPYATIVDEN